MNEQERKRWLRQIHPLDWEQGLEKFYQRRQETARLALRIGILLGGGLTALLGGVQSEGETASYSTLESGTCDQTISQSTRYANGKLRITSDRIDTQSGTDIGPQKPSGVGGTTRIHQVCVDAMRDLTGHQRHSPEQIKDLIRTWKDWIETGGTGETDMFPTAGR